MCQYDENLYNNTFLREILTNHTDIVKRASQESWIICIPRSGTFNHEEISIDTILDHFLIPSSIAPNQFCTLSKKQISVKNKEIIPSETRPIAPIRILFEETFYIEALKYPIWCLEQPLFVTRAICHNHRPETLDTLHDCIDFLWSENMGQSLERVQILCNDFMDNHQELAVENLQTQKELIGNLYSQCLQVALKNRSLCTGGVMDNIKLAVETYMQSCIENTLIRAVNTLTCYEDAAFNKTIRQYSDLQVKDLNISNKFCDIITNAKRELGRINNYTTILDKIHCLKQTFTQLYNTNQKLCIATDDIIQIFVFIIIKLNINNWISNLVFLTQFRFSTLNSTDEASFLVTSLEAAVEFIKTNKLQENNPSSHNQIFAAISADNLTQFKKLLNYKQKRDVEIDLCHPLCDCDKCANKLINSSHDIEEVNDKGQSLLIYSTLYDRCNFVEFLIGIGADVDHQDYCGRTALHYACLKGYQDVLLILINCKAKVNIADNGGNTPLHLSVSNGHESCVKALIYTCKNLDINCVNKHGNTGLHLAVKWSFIDLMKILLENNASTSIINRKHQLPVSLADNYYTETILKRYSTSINDNGVKIGSPTGEAGTNGCKEHGIRPKSIDQIKKIDLLLKAIENNDLPLTCFYLGFSNDSSTEYNFQSKCHPLCNCEKCEDSDERPKEVLEHLNVNTCNINGFTPLHFAAKYGRMEILRILLDSGALPNLKTYKTSQTPLHLACIYQRAAVVKELARCGDCDVNVQDYKGNTPLFYACLKNNERIVEVLLNNGASSDVQNYEGTTIIREVQEKQLYGISKLLKDQNRIGEDHDFL